MKNFIIIALILGIVYVGYLYHYERKTENVYIDTLAPEARAYAQAEVENINTKISQKGFKVAVIEAVSNTVGNIDLVRDSLKRFKDSAVLVIGAKDKQIVSLTRYNATLKDSLLVANIVGDTSFRYANNGLKLELNKPNGKPAYFNYSYDANINYAEYWKRRNFLAPKEQFIDFWIEDTRATINGVQRLKIAPKKDKVKLDINASSFYIDRLNIGIDADWDIGRYNLGAGYYYDMDRKTWRPVLKAKFKLLEF